MKILSFDWDYFCCLNLKSDLPIQGLLYDWKTRDDGWGQLYSKYPGLYYATGPDVIRCGTIERIFKYHTGPYMACEDHGRAYAFIQRVCPPDEELEIHHVDYHHDCYMGTSKVDCANWLRRLYDERKNVRAKWFRPSNAASDIVLDIPKFTYDFLKTDKYDAIFVCRSDSYSLPHLDYEFIRVMIPKVEDVQHMSEVTIEDCVLRPRPLLVENTVLFNEYP